MQTPLRFPLQLKGLLGGGVRSVQAWVNWSLIFLSICLLLYSRHITNIRKIEVTLRGPGGSVYSISMSYKDRRYLERFFRYLIFDNYFGYTLLGSKPLSLGAYREFSRDAELIDNYPSFLPESKRLRLGWKTWLKYRHHFENAPYSLWVEKSPWIKNGMLVVLANKATMASTMHRHATDFEQVLGTNEIKNFVVGDRTIPLLADRLRGHDGLIGTLLGYGRENSWKFFDTRKRENLRDLCCGEGEQEELMRPLTLKSFALSALSAQHRNDISKQLAYVNFAADPNSEETTLLKLEYRKMRQRIIEYYADKDFLETTLSLFKYGQITQATTIESQTLGFRSHTQLIK